jgi:hypothetical protein
MIDPILQRPLRVRKCLGTTSKLHFLANVVPPFLAPFALLARLSHFQRNFVPDFEILDV